MRSSLFAAAASAVVLAGSNAAFAQDVNSAFITKCPAGQWALTFDDGPSALTPELLQTLQTAGVVASFFILGVQLENPEFAKSTKAAFDAGHLIASHTYSHIDLNSLTAAQVKDQMTRTEASIKAITGFTPNYMRPPFGNCSTVCAGVMKELGYVVSSWDVDSNDWRVKDTPEESKVIDTFTTAAATAAAAGHMSLQHDTIPFSVKMVPQIIAAIKAKGITFVTADKCSGGAIPAYREAGAPTPGSSGTGSEVAPTSSGFNAATAAASAIAPGLAAAAAAAVSLASAAAAFRM